MNKVKLTGFVLGPSLFIITYLFLSKWSGLSPEACKVLAVAAWMVSWWVTEAVNVSVTALIPMALMPMLGIMSVQEATASYGNSVIFLFMGGFILALALEKHNLHQRIALNLILLTGTSGNGIIAGFMLSAGFISMWISNTATAIMMLPIALSVTQLISKELTAQANPAFEKGYGNFATALMLGIAYGSSIGGMATIIGTPPNVVMMGLFRETYKVDITFLEWIKTGFPVAFTTLVACFLVLTRWIFPNRLTKIPGSRELIMRKLRDAGPLSRAEWLVLAVFFLTSFCWIFRPYVNASLAALFYSDGSERQILDDTVIAMTGGLLMFSVPVSIRKHEFLLSWEDTKRLPWGILILFGGGICIAKSLEDVKLIQMIGEYIAARSDMERWLLVLVLTGISLLLTELMSNVALATIFVPVVFGIADAFGYDPLLLALPVTFAASCAFSMPISTPPNAVLFASGYIRLADMMKAGIVLNIIAIVIIVFLTLLLTG